ncbi:MAG TPA: transcriptional repressor LexA [Anaerolineae bacterium]|jgi:repressor LexA
MPAAEGPRLSERQQQILAFIHRYERDKHRPPTIREIGAAVGISSTSVVNYNLNILQREGLIAREKEVSRGLRLTRTQGNGNRNVLQIPLLGRIVAGKPVPIPEPGTSGLEGETIELTRDLVSDPENLYALHVKGDSMIDASIHDGDIVVLKHQQTALNGDMIAAWLEDRHETTLKRYYRVRDKVRLQPANPNYDPIVVDARNVKVQGKVVLVIRQMGKAA